MVKRNTGQKRWGYKNELGQRQELFTTAGVDLLRGLVALAVGLFLVHWVMKLFERYEAKMKLEPTLRGFIKNLIRILLYVIVIMTAANTMGIPMTSIITLLGSAGVAISLAMQGAMGNLIGGFILLLFKPIKAGEYLSADGCAYEVVTERHTCS